jgi:hypothetical protein
MEDLPIASFVVGPLAIYGIPELRKEDGRI